MNRWIENKLYDLTKESFDLLLQHRIPGIRIRDFVDRETSERVADRLKKLAFKNYDHLKNIPVQHLGVCQNQLAREPRSVYFSKIQEAKQQVGAIFEGITENPVQKLIRTLSQTTNRRAQIFQERDYGEYFAGAFRSFSGHGKLHVDHAPSHIEADWDIKQITHQLTWNIYFCVPKKGGELVIHDTIHTPENELKKIPGDYYFPYSVLENDRCIRVQPQIGELIIFNTQNFHEIFGTPEDKRISLTSFMGIRRDGSINLWS